METSEKHLNIKIIPVPVEEIYPIRQEVLRKGKPISACYFDGDKDEKTLHIGAFSEEKIVGAATFLKNKNNQFTEAIQFQLRGMAVLPNLQGQKIGNKILFEAEKILIAQNETVLIWCNSRESATKFYLNNSFQISGPPFEIHGIGKHFLMFKKIK